MGGSLPRGVSGRPARQVAVSAAREAGGIIRELFGTARTVGHKGRGNFVTEADLLAERAILGRLRQEFPEHGIVAEESEAIAGRSGYVWVVDPLDGTTNFAMQLSFFAVAIALTLDGQAILGVIYDPMRRELFVAEQGCGATLAGKAIGVAGKVDLGNAVVCFDLGYEEEGRRVAMEVARLVRPQVQGLRLIGSAVLGQAYVACGRFDLYFHQYLYPWDVAAAQILVREAGGVVTEWDGVNARIESKGIVAANPYLQQAFLEVAGLRQAAPR